MWYSIPALNHTIGKGKIRADGVSIEDMSPTPMSMSESSYSRDPELGVSLSEEEKVAAEESFMAYCNPVELYNILRHHADGKPRFLERSLRYKIQEKHKRRIQLSVSIPNGLEARSPFPFYILLAKPIPTSNGETPHSSFYRFKRASMLTVVNGAQTASSVEAKFILPDYNILSTQIVSGSVAMLLVSCADLTFSKGMCLVNDVFMGYCLMGKISLDFLHLSTEKSRNLSRGERVRTTSEVSMESCYMMLSCSDGEKHISFILPHKSKAVSILQQVPVICAAEELGAKYITPYDLNECNNTLSNVMPQILRLRAGNVIFNYKYYNNMMQRTEVTEDYGCPFCLIKCGSYKGLKCHLMASHDLLRFDFLMNKDYQVVDVTTVTDAYFCENFGSGIPKRENYSFRNPASRSQNANHEHQLVLTSVMPATFSDSRGVSERVECNLSGPYATPVSNHAVITLCRPQSGALQVPGSNPSPPLLSESAKTRKLSNKRSDHGNQMQNRQFYHSHIAQPMTFAQVYAEHDSEDEVDDDIADIEDQRLLDDFVDVTRDEKQVMHLWNSFVRRQRVLVDVHIPWACETFSVKHGEDLAKTPQLLWCWSLFLIKLYNQGLLDTKTMDKCKAVLDANKG